MLYLYVCINQHLTSFCNNAVLYINIAHEASQSSPLGSSTSTTPVTRSNFTRAREGISTPTSNLSVPGLGNQYHPAFPHLGVGRAVTTATQSEEHRRVFQYVKGEKAASARKEQALQKLPTCTMKFCCLGSVNDEKPPTTVSAKTVLANSGLGPATMDGGTLHSRLLSRYPKLENAGGYELLLYQRGGEEQGFHHLPGPHTPSRIKEIANASVIYIWPLQLDIQDLNADDTCQSEEVRSVPNNN